MKLNLKAVNFSITPETIVEHGEFKAVAFRYPSGVEALRVYNRRGSFTILPWMGQQLWRCDFDGCELAMKSMYEEPVVCTETFEDGYGCFLMHCGMLAMGNPTPEDTHVGHGELPIARYQEAYIELGDDFIAVGGAYNHVKCLSYNYTFSPKVTLRRGAGKLEIEATVKNNMKMPLEYYYLCHINHRPVDGSKVVESPMRRPPVINHEVPDGYYRPWAEATKKWLSVLDKDYQAQAVIGAKGESYKPEIVNCYFHKPDAQGWAFIKQMYPKKAGKVNGVFVRYRPSELPYATRWIARTGDEDAFGMCLPATAEHKGRNYCQAHKQQKYLAPGKTFTTRFETGVL